MTTQKCKVPKGKVLVTCSSDWFSNEVFYTAHDAGEEVTEQQLREGQLIDSGKSIEVTERLRNDGPGEPRDWTVTDLLIANHGGQSVTKVRSKKRVG